MLVTSRPAPTGKTAHLAHGLSVAGLAGEGVGFGVPLAQYPDGAVFAGSVSWSGSWRAVYNLDTMVGDARHQYRFEKVPTRGRVTVDYVRKSRAEARRTRRLLGRATGLDVPVQPAVVLSLMP